MTENQEYIQEQIQLNVYAGFYDNDEILELIMEIIEDEELDDEISESWVLNEIRKLRRERELASKEWEKPTDIDCLVKAFNVLQKEGVIALHNAGYTSSDALSDASEVYHMALEQGLSPIGYCYYHGQDLERVLDGDGLMIGFDSADGEPESRLEIGQKVLEVLQAEELTCTWEGVENQRIFVDMVWESTYQGEEYYEASFAYDRILNKV